MSQPQHSLPELPPDVTDVLRQRAAELHYAYKSLPHLSSNETAMTTLEESFRSAAKDIALVLGRYSRSVTELPEVALGAIYEYNRTKIVKPSPKFDIEHVKPISGKDLPARYNGQRIGVRGNDFGMVSLLQEGEVLREWWKLSGSLCDRVIRSVLSSAGIQRPQAASRGTARRAAHNLGRDRGIVLSRVPVSSPLLSRMPAGAAF